MVAVEVGLRGVGVGNVGGPAGPLDAVAVRLVDVDRVAARVVPALRLAAAHGLGAAHRVARGVKPAQVLARSVAVNLHARLP